MRAGRAGARVSARPGTRTSGGAAPWTRHWWWFGLRPWRIKGCCTVKKVSNFPVPGCPLPNSPSPGKLLKLFYSVLTLFSRSRSRVKSDPPGTKLQLKGF
jgi:hypothetical protein